MDNFFYLDKGLVNKKYHIIKVNGSNKIKRRLLELGFVDTDIMILKKSSLNGVFLLQLRGFVLALKRKEVCNILVKSYE